MAAPPACPSCRAAMTPLGLERKPVGAVEIDLCFACQGIWFDGFESTQMVPGGVINLFRLIHEHRDALRQPLTEILRCPRCDGRLRHDMDIAKSGRFNYHRCPAQHGRFTTFGQFMIEKGFVRQLSGAEIDQIKARIAVVRCASCGAPVDIRQDAACSHCRSPIAVLDSAAVEKALAAYRQAEITRTTLDPAALADAILMKERERGARQREKGAAPGSDIADLVVAGIGMISGLLG